jgi:hypothetical protein
MVDHINKNLITSTYVKELVTLMETQVKTHMVNRVTLVQTLLTSKSRGLKTFVVDVFWSLGRRLMDLEVKPAQKSIVTNARVETT